MAKHIFNVPVTPPSQTKVCAIHTELEMAVAVKASDWRSLKLPIYDQGELGSCTGFAIAKGLRELLDLQANRTHVPYSALFQYYEERVAERTVNQDAGATITDGVAVLLHMGACPDVLDPYHPVQFKLAPTPAAFTAAKKNLVSKATHLRSVTAIKQALVLGPVVGGIPVYDGDNGLEGTHAEKTGFLGMPEPSDQLLGGHAICLVGWDPVKDVFIARNSWGPDWGDQGHFYIPEAYVARLAAPVRNDWWMVTL